MEAAALNRWREHLAECLIPPGARESVMGDLRESCALFFLNILSLNGMATQLSVVW